ncbi:probable microtubule-binding protein TANGLED [Magnolia sinica]|uniref:probable microtubule-binding protein TANGLED n=1 Tax=Magnolia sinica TaxID=86752 RepID=UPI00265A2F42|nr:probable microtubule-binding protein TANGLED [Magnolia sinica]
MVAKTPTKEKRTAVALNPNLLRETVKKMDRCMARLQELQYTVTGGNKVIAGISLSPRSTKGYLRTSLRCKQESLRIKNTATRVSPVGKMHDNTGEWRRMSLPAMLVRETVIEILQASRFAKEVATAVAKANQTASDLPKTPETGQKKNRPHFESTQLQARRKLEKQGTLQFIRSESNSPTRRRVRSRITFKVSPKKKTELGKENQHLANRVSPRNRPWAKKTVLFPNPLFLSSPSSHQHKFCKTRSPVIGKMRQTPHKFAIKSHPTLPEFQSKIRNPAISPSPTRQTISKLPKLTASNTASKLRLSFSPSKLRHSFSPSKLASRLVSPLKNRISVQKSGGLVRGMKHRPSLTPIRFSGQRI